MTLSVSSFLHYWTARYGSVPIIGGAPTFARSSAGQWIDQNGILQSAIVNTPRMEWADLGDGAGRRQVMRLEQARTNLIGLDVSGWTPGSVTITTGKADPKGGAGASLLTTTAGGGEILANMAFTGTGAKLIGVCMKQGSAAATTFGLFDASASAWRFQVLVTWTNGVPTLTDSGAGGTATIFPAIPLAGGWYYLAIAPNGVVAANTNNFYVYPCTPSGTGSVTAFLAQAQNAPTPSSIINLSSSLAADSFYWTFTPVPQGMMIYVRFVERGSASNADGLLSITATAEAGPLLRLYSSSGKYAITHSNGSVTPNAILAAGPNQNDVVELIGVLYPDGHVRIIQSINGTAVTSAVDATTATLAAAWSGQQLFANSRGSSLPGLADFAEIKIPKYVDVVASGDQGIHDEIAAFELGPNGVQL